MSDMLLETSRPPQIKIIDGGLKAQIELAPKEFGMSYTKTEIMDLLAQHHVKQGVNKELLADIVENGRYGVTFTIAEGKPAVDGRDGYYEYYFRTQLDKKPKIREDGSVDYAQIDLIEKIKEGQVVAKYFESTNGTFGYSVEGKIIKPRPGKKRPPLTGSGFNVLDDGNTYVAAINGGISLYGNKLIISPVYVLKGDMVADHGDISFDGSVEIHGSIIGNAKIEATGDVTVDGNVEDAMIHAGGNILLKKGMKGQERGILVSEKAIIGTFFEYTKVRCKQELVCDYLYSCDVECRDTIQIQKMKGTIMGGKVYAWNGIETYFLGNRAELKTEIGIGMDEEFWKNLMDTQQKLARAKKELSELETARGKLGSGQSGLLGKMNDTINAKQEEVDTLQIILNNSTYLSEKARHAKIIVKKTVYGGVTVFMQQMQKTIPTELDRVEISCRGAEIRVQSLD